MPDKTKEILSTSANAKIPWVVTPSGDCVVRPVSGLGPLDNPLKGWCPYTDGGALTQPYSMVYQYVSWRELEPREGEYQFDAWEKRAWDFPTARGKHVIFRVYIDYPAQASGLPEWLKAKGVKTHPYMAYQENSPPSSTSVSPDYEHPAFIAALEKLIAALGARYNKNPRVAFLQLGTLGFWGEWHTYPVEKLFASKAVQQRVVEAYHAAFPDKKIMARYPGHYTGQQPWIGFHDDMFPEDTGTAEDWQFLSGLKKAGRAENWRKAVIGGEMVPGAADKWVGPQYDQTMRMLEAVHFTWVGPYCPAMKDKPSAEYLERSQALVRRMGYQYQLTQIHHPAKIRAGNALPITIQGKNTGVAPFYYPWLVQLALLDSRHRAVASVPLSTDVRQWQPGPFTVKARPRLSAKPGTYRLAIGIIDPWKKKPAIEFANALPVHDGWTLLSPVTIS